MIRSSKLPLIVLVIVFLGIAFYFSRQNQEIKSIPGSSPKPTATQASQNESPKIISTKPDLSAETIISATETIEITFNRPLENIGEFKHKIEPKIEYKAELSQDRKTVKIIPQKPYELGAEYTIFIYPDSKFDSGGRLDGEKIFHFKTVRYRGV